MKWNGQYVYNLASVESTLKNVEMIYNAMYLEAIGKYTPSKHNNKVYNTCFFATTTFRLFICPSSGR
jgi:hypothetical protein